jgi:hypothetical protein
MFLAAGAAYSGDDTHAGRTHIKADEYVIHRLLWIHMHVSLISRPGGRQDGRCQQYPGWFQPG